MSRAVNERDIYQERTEDSPRRRVAMLACAILLVGGSCLLPFLSSPRPDRPAGIVFGPGGDAAWRMDTIVRSDPDPPILDVAVGGLVVYVRYSGRAFAVRVKRLGAIHAFDAVAAGYHASEPRWVASRS